MKRGEIRTIQVEFDFTTATTNDWAVTAWGESGAVLVRHSDEGEETHHFAHFKADGTVQAGPAQPIPDEGKKGSGKSEEDGNDGGDNPFPDGGDGGDDTFPDGGDDGDDTFPDGDDCEWLRYLDNEGKAVECNTLEGEEK